MPALGEQLRGRDWVSIPVTSFALWFLSPSRSRSKEFSGLAGFTAQFQMESKSSQCEYKKTKLLPLVGLGSCVSAFANSTSGISWLEGVCRSQVRAGHPGCSGLHLHPTSFKAAEIQIGLKNFFQLQFELTQLLILKMFIFKVQNT